MTEQRRETQTGDAVHGRHTGLRCDAVCWSGTAAPADTRAAADSCSA